MGSGMDMGPRAVSISFAYGHGALLPLVMSTSAWAITQFPLPNWEGVGPWHRPVSAFPLTFPPQVAPAVAYSTVWFFSLGLGKPAIRIFEEKEMMPAVGPWWRVQLKSSCFFFSRSASAWLYEVRRRPGASYIHITETTSLQTCRYFPGFGVPSRILIQGPSA